MKIAYIGLGVIGAPLAGHLVSAGYDLQVFNRTQSKSDEWSKKFRGQVCTTPAEACKDVDIAFCCVGDDPDVTQVLLGDNGALSSLRPGSLFVDHTTTSAALARKLYADCYEQEVAFIDAPVSGGEVGAINGKLTIMCGGRKEDFQRIESILQIYARHAQLMGPPGSGQLTKMVNQVCIAGVIQGLAEALILGQKAGLDMEAVIDVISKGAAQSWQMDNRAKTMLDGEFDFGFAVDWMRKDLRICMEQAGMLNVEMPVTALVDSFYAAIQIAGGGRWDTSSLIFRQSSQSTKQT
ncbi:MAG: NAD(P)-dependent oxidoreductase [Rhodospirillaceae bacterium]